MALANLFMKITHRVEDTQVEVVTAEAAEDVEAAEAVEAKGITAEGAEAVIPILKNK